MEEFLKWAFTEKGISTGLLIGILIGLYFLSRFGITKYIKLQKDYNETRLKQQRDHNADFLKSFDNMIEKISSGDTMHSEEHDVLLKTISDRHDNNNEQHEKMIGMIKENTDNIKLTHESIENLNKVITLHHKPA